MMLRVTSTILLFALVRAKPDTITYASGGAGGQVHLAFALPGVREQEHNGRLPKGDV